jgi:hypothetical protein
MGRKSNASAENWVYDACLEKSNNELVTTPRQKEALLFCSSVLHYHYYITRVAFRRDKSAVFPDGLQRNKGGDPDCLASKQHQEDTMKTGIKNRTSLAARALCSLKWEEWRFVYDLGSLRSLIIN